jgi:hypothetical protein
MQNEGLLPKPKVWTYVKGIFLVMLDLNAFVLLFLFEKIYIKKLMADDTIFEIFNSIWFGI